MARELDEPRPFPRQLPVGCARYPWHGWEEVYLSIDKAQSLPQLAVAWDLVLRGVEEELAGRRDIVGTRKQCYVGREGPVQQRT
eukprot:2437899-Pyramimonas_sp.AAC.1